MNKIERISEPTNGGAPTIGISKPYVAKLTITGSADILFHAWNPEAVEEKSRASKGSKAKKSDDIESYVYRNGNNQLCLPGEYLRMSLVTAAKYRQDPRSPRKSAMDLFKAGVVCLTPLASLGIETWDYLDKRRVVVQRNGINRSRPAIRAGWTADFELQINTPEYISRGDLLDTINMAGRLVGVGDFRPTFGRFAVTDFKVD